MISRSIALDIKELDEPYQKLGKGLAFLQQAWRKCSRIAEDLSSGNLSGGLSVRGQFPCVNLKISITNLNHLTWQAKQVASGDYSPACSYLGGNFRRPSIPTTAQLEGAGDTAEGGKRRRSRSGRRLLRNIMICLWR